MAVYSTVLTDRGFFSKMLIVPRTEEHCGEWGRDRVGGQDPLWVILSCVTLEKLLRALGLTADPCSTAWGKTPESQRPSCTAPAHPPAHSSTCPSGGLAPTSLSLTSLPHWLGLSHAQETQE